MKKLMIVSLLLAAAMLFCACNGGESGTSTAADTSEPVTSAEAPATTVPDDTQTTEAPDDTQTTEDTTAIPETDLRAEFFAAHKGYWTEENGRFITFDVNEKGEYRATFAVWNAGGPFPSGNVTEVKKAGEGLYFLMITIDGMPDDPEWYGDGWDPYDVTVSIVENNTDPASFDCVAVGDSEQRRYFNHTNPENPFMPQQDLIGDFVSRYKGYWTESDGCFIYISEEDRRINFSKWNTGGGSPSGNITDVAVVGAGSYKVTVQVDAFAGNEEIGGWDAYEFIVEFTDLKTTDPETAKANHPYLSGYQTYRHHAEPGDPFIKEQEDMIDEFLSLYNGYWTEKDGRFIYISKKDGGVSFAIWNSGGSFPGGPVTEISKDGSGMYTLKIYIPAMPDNDENTGWDAYDIYLHFKLIDKDPVTASADHPFLDGYHTFYYHSTPGNPFYS